MSINDLVNVREFKKEDLNFILSSSILSLSKYKESIIKGQDQPTAYNYLEKQILFALNYLSYSVFIACDSKDSDNIIGYIVADTLTNHIFLQYTKYNYRGLGIQKHLLLPLVTDPNEIITVNWPTKEMLKLVSQGKVNIQNKLVESMIEQMSEFLNEN